MADSVMKDANMDAGTLIEVKHIAADEESPEMPRPWTSSGMLI